MRRCVVSLFLALLAVAPVSAQNELRIRANFLPALRIDSIAAGDTLIRDAQLANYPVVDSTNHLAVTLDRARANGAPEIIYLRKHLSGADSAYVVRAREGTSARMHPDSTEGVHAPTVRDFAAGKVAFARRTAGTLTLNSTTWADLDTGLDLTLLGCYVGDVVEAGMSVRWGNEGVFAFLDVVSVVSGSPVNSWALNAAPDDTAGGVTGWHAPGDLVVGESAGSPLMRRITSGDLAVDTLRLRFRYRTASAANKTLIAITLAPLHVWAKNHGPLYVAPTY